MSQLSTVPQRSSPASARRRSIRDRVGNADGGDALGVDMGGVHRLGHGLALCGPDLHGVVLHPAGLGIDLPEGPLGPGDDAACAVEQNGPGAGGALIQRHYILTQTDSLPLFPV